MYFLKAICLIFLISLSQIPTKASDEIEAQKYPISFMGLEMMKMECTFHVDVVRGQEVEAIKNTLAEVYQPFLVNNNSFLTTQKSLILAKASNEVKGFLEEAFIYLEEYFSPKREETPILLASDNNKCDTTEHLGLLVAAILPPSEPPHQGPPSDKEENKTTSLPHLQQEEETHSESNSFNPVLINAESDESIEAKEPKDLSPRMVDPTEVQNQGFSELPLTLQEEANLAQAFVETPQEKPQEIYKRIYSQIMFALKKNFQTPTFLSPFMNWQAVVEHETFSKYYRSSADTEFIHLNKEVATSLNAFDDKKNVNYPIDALSQIYHLMTVALQEKKLLEIDVLGSSQGWFKISPRLGTSKETSLSQASFMSVQAIYDFVYEWLRMNKSFFIWKPLNSQTALFLAYILTFIFFCYPQFSGLVKQKSIRTRRRRA